MLGEAWTLAPLMDWVNLYAMCQSLRAYGQILEAKHIWLIMDMGTMWKAYGRVLEAEHIRPMMTSDECFIIVKRRPRKLTRA